MLQPVAAALPHPDHLVEVADVIEYVSGSWLYQQGVVRLA